jgi:hypothetical protein
MNSLGVDINWQGVRGRMESKLPSGIEAHRQKNQPAKPGNWSKDFANKKAGQGSSSIKDQKSGTPGGGHIQSYKSTKIIVKGMDILKSVEKKQREA